MSSLPKKSVESFLKRLKHIAEKWDEKKVELPENEKESEGSHHHYSAMNIKPGADLLAVLDDELMSLAFLDFLRKSYNNENFSFWLEVEEFKGENETKDINKVKIERRVKAIKEKFLTTGSEYELNLRHSTRAKIEEKIVSQTYSPEMFDEAQTEVAEMLSFDW